MLLDHPRIYLDAHGETTDALLVRDGRVVAVGGEARLAASSADEVVRPETACVFPALGDAHIHLWGLSLRPGSIDLAGCGTTREVYRALDAAAEKSPERWVLGHDWDQHKWSDAESLEIDHLDASFPSQPVVLRRVDGHALWVNSEALRRAGIADGFDPGPNGAFVRTADGRASGLLVDDAMNPVLDAMPATTVDEDREVFLQSCELLKSFGIASAHIAWMPTNRLEMLEVLRQADGLPIRLHLMFDGRDEALDRLLHRGPIRDPWLSQWGIKYFADGALGSRGAHLLGCYEDGSRGLVLESEETLRSRAVELSRNGWQMCVHAIGDAAVRNTLDAFAAMSDDARAVTRPRVEHAQMASMADCRRFAALGAIASIQPIHMYSDAAWADSVLDEAQLEHLFPWRPLAEYAPCLAAGSDYPIEDPNPWHGVATAVRRLDARGREFRAEDRLSRQEILHAYTAGAAWAAGWESEVGRLRPGFRADFCALSHDPLGCDAEELWEIESRGLWIEGRRAAS